MGFLVELQQGNVLVVQGQITSTNVMSARKAGEAIIREMPNDGVIDLSSVESASAVTLSLLLAWLRTAKDNKLSLLISNMPQKLFDMARVSGLEVILPIISDHRSQ